jgi:hypothetical protein
MSFYHDEPRKWIPPSLSSHSDTGQGQTRSKKTILANDFALPSIAQHHQQNYADELGSTLVKSGFFQKRSEMDTNQLRSDPRYTYNDAQLAHENEPDILMDEFDLQLLRDTSLTSPGLSLPNLVAGYQQQTSELADEREPTTPAVKLQLCKSRLICGLKILLTRR